MKYLSRLPVVAVAFAVTVTVIVAGIDGAWAFWTTGGSGGASATLATLDAPTGVAASVAAGSGTAQVSWTATPAPGGGGVDGYYVQRYAGVTASPACASSPTTLVAGPTCADTGLADGTYTYKVTAIFRSWTATSTASAPLTIANDVTAPTASVTFPADASTVGATAYAAGCAPAGVCGAAGDPGSGVSSVKVSIRQGSGNWWGGSAFDQAAETFVPATLATAGATSTAWRYPLPLPAAGGYVVHVQATDVVGNAQTGTTYAATSSFTIDTAGPVVSLIRVNGATVTFPFTTGASVTTVGGACGTAAGDSATVEVAVTGTAAQTGTATCTSGVWTYTASPTLSAAGAYSVTATQADGSGNSGTSGPQSITIDTAGPVVSLTRVNGATVTFPFTTGASVTTVGGACGTAAGDSATVTVTVTGAGTQTGTATCTTGVWTYTASPALSAAGTYSVTATQADGSGNSGTSGPQSITVDTAGPVVSLTSVNGATVTFPFTTGASVTTVGGACGTAAGDSATVDVAVTGTAAQTGTATCTAGAWTYTASPALSAAGTYSVTATQADSGGNTGTSGPQSITIDTTGPTVSLTKVNGATVTFPFATNAASLTSFGGACGTAAGDSTTVAVTVTGAGTQTGNATCTAGAWTYTTAPALTAVGAYSVTATQADSGGNTGTSAAKAITVDRTAPAATLALAPGAVRSFLNGTTLYFNGDAAGSFKLVATVTDAGSGPASAAFPVQATSGWTHGAETVTTPTGGPYTSTIFTFTSTAGTPGTYAVTVVDGAGNAATVNVTFNADTTNPTGAFTSPASGAVVSGAAVAVAATATDGGSGLASAQFQTSPAGAGTWTNLGAADITSPYEVTWNTTTGYPDGSYDLRVVRTDNVGRTDTDVSTVTVQNSAPTPTSVVLKKNGGTAGKAEQGDQVIVTYSQALKVSSLCSVWSGDASNQSITSNSQVTVNVADGGAGNDTLTVASTTCTFRFGSINLGAVGYATGGSLTFSGSSSSTKSTITWDVASRTLTILLGAKGGAGTNGTVASSAATYTPDAAITNIAGTAIAGTFTTATVAQF
ncbi:MAG: beta strand repeat-containing protein [Acidimicrobiales bacterium]